MYAIHFNMIRFLFIADKYISPKFNGGSIDRHWSYGIFVQCLT